MNFDFDKALRGVRQGAPSFQQAIYPTTGLTPYGDQQTIASELEVARAEQAKKAQELSSSHLKVLFVSDLCSELESFELKQFTAQNSVQKKLEKYFKVEVIELFAKMVMAMGLKDSEFDIKAIKHQALEGPVRDISMDLEKFAYKQRPTMIITLGATATNMIMGFEERLASVHGKFFTKVFGVNGENFSVQVMPLFHPQLLQINPGMKRTAWADMQKSMEFLKLN